MRALAMCAGGLALALVLAHTMLFQRMSGWLHDAEQRALARPVDLDAVVVFDVDEESLRRLSARLGGWPYDYDIFAAVSRYLTARGARAVVFDVLFADERPGADLLARSVQRNMVLAAAGIQVALPASAGYQQQLETYAIARESGGQAPVGAMRQNAPYPHQHWPFLKLPIEALTRTDGARIGVVNLQPDDDGVVRRVALFHDTQGYVFPSLAIATLLAGDSALTDLRYETGLLQGGRLQMRKSVLPVTAGGEALLRFPANRDDLRVIAFHELVTATAGSAGSEWLAREIAGKTVFIGSSTVVGGGYSYTPVGRLSNLELGALVYTTLATGFVMTPEMWWLDALLVLAALGLPFALARRGPDLSGRHFLGACVALGLLLAAAGIALAAAGFESRWLLALGAGLTSLAIVFSAWLFSVSDERRRLRYETLAARETTRLKTEFLNHLTHELRTPLTAIMGFNKLNQFTDDLGRDSRIRNGAIIGRNCEHLLQLINNQLDLAKLEAGTVAIVHAPEDPDQLCRDTIERMQSFAEEKRVRLKYSRATPLPLALALDPFRVRQILINLLGNALKFTQAGTVELTAFWHVAALVLEVRDSGPGIAPEALSRIFEPYQQADATIAQRYGGTGLGLAITRQLVDLMGGQIEVESKPGLGSTFRVRIPTEAVACRETTVHPITDAQALREPLAGRVLVAEDNEDIRALVKLQLSKLGVDVVAVANGFTAVEHALAEPFDAILMDMEMPVMNGYEAVHVLRTRNYTGTILALTAHQEGLDVERAVSAGCDGVVTKPVSLESLRTALRPVLREARKSGSRRA